MAVWSCATVLFGAVTLSPFIRIDRVVTSSSGQIASTAELDTFQALDPSIVRQINVKEGQEVQAGQVLATLDSTITQADVSQLRQEIGSLDAEIGRAMAERDGMAFNVPKNTPAANIPYWTLQSSLYEQRAASIKAQMNSLNEKISALDSTLLKLRGDAARYSERDKIARQVEEMRSMLYKSGASSLVSLLEASDARLQLLQSLDSGQNSLIETQHELASVQADRDALLSGWNTSIDQELVTARNSRDTAISALNKASRHDDLVRIIAPHHAVVLSIDKISAGSVLRQGDEIMRLAPLDVDEEAEIHLSSREIGFVRPGDPVVLKVNAYNSYEHGNAEGKIEWISEGAFTEDENGQPVSPFYKARVTITALDFHNLPQAFRLVPGMTLIADVKVGTRSIFTYVMAGMLRGDGEVMREP